MKKLALCLALMMIYPSCWGLDDDATFISLNRHSTPLNHLPTNISTITQEDIEKMGARNLTEVLDRFPAVDLSRSGALGSSAFVRLRGIPSANQVQILVDDQPLGGVSIQNIDAGRIPIDNIERIEIVRGASSVLYGANTVGGAINIITKKQLNDKPTLKAELEARSL